MKLTAADAGCWLDGAMGWHNNYRVVDRALEHGWEPADKADVETITNAYHENFDTVTLASGEVIDTAEAVIGQGGLSDQATDYLQSIAPEGYVFEWDCGELTLIAETETEWWEE